MRLRLAVALSGLLVAVPATALAAHLTGTARPDRLVGTAHTDTIDGRAGNDTIQGLAGNDLLIGGLGRDRITGGAGNDSVAANGDSARDMISCGTGVDVVDADLSDAVGRDCELTSRQVSTDTVAGGTGQHATEVEPDGFAFGSTIVTAFQVGRIENGGATAIGFSTSTDGARTWRSGLLPGLTVLSPQPGADARASDPSVAFDAAHGMWLTASLGIGSDHFDLLISRSVDGVHWTIPVVARVAPAGMLDKEWIACDNWASSPNRGRCYLSYLDVSSGLIVTQATTDGGLTWSGPALTSIQPPSGVDANGAQPLPRPDGSLVVVYAVGAAERDEAGKAGDALVQTPLSAEVLAATSADGGATFAPSVHIADLTSATVPGVRAPPLPSADVGADGRLFVAWHDCRLDSLCGHDRILVSSSPDGQSWSRPEPVAPAGRTVSQFVPGLAVDQATGRLAVVYYTLTECSTADCPRIDVWLASSANGGATWAAPRRLDAQSMQLDWLPRAGGRFLGDYLSTSWVAGRAVPVYSLAVQPWGGKLREAIMALQTG